MEVVLYNSTVCRLCGEENDSGNLLYSCEDNNPNLCDLINLYLPIKVSDDGILPRTICPGCTIQLEATVEFLSLIINGQKVIRELHQREKEYKKSILSSDNDTEDLNEKIIYEINTDDGVYQLEHPITLQVSGQEKPKRKRGRPPKKPKSPDEIAQELVAKENELAKKATSDEEVTGKRRRKAPTRYKEAVQGKELERIFIEEGVIDETESVGEVKPEVEVKPPAKEPEVIGHLENSGELVMVVKGKGRGRPKGRMRQTREECSICGMEFSSVGRYMSHVAQHGPVRYRCEQCGLTSDTLIQHQAHQKDSQHTGQVVIPCKGGEDTEKEAVKVVKVVKDEDPLSLEQPVQGKSLPSLADDGSEGAETSDHRAPKDNTGSLTVNAGKSAPVINDPEEIIELALTPKGKPKLKCNQCEKTFNSKQSRSLHIKAVHQSEKPYECEECGVKFAYPRSLALHMISHRRHRTSAKRYACDLCGKVLNHPSSVVYHKEAEHANQRYVCNKCGKSFKHKQLLQRHQLVHSQLRPYSCKTCNASFKTKANLINHQLLHSGVKKFSCEICKHKFAHKTSLTLHMRWHTGTKPFGCKTCGKSFSQKGNLSEHERIHSGEKPYQCSLCPRRFTTSSQYRLHARRHQPDRPYACTHCPKRFLSRASFLAHQRRSLGQRAHGCGVCSRSFSERWALVKHMRRHTGERPHRCPHCPRAFADCSNLSKHKKQVHKQISLLVNNEKTDKSPLVEPEEQLVIQQRQPSLSLQELQPADDAEDGGVIYVTYDVDVDDSQSAFTIIEPEQAGALVGGALSPALLADTTSEHIAVTDEQGNPLHFTMQDGTRLAVTSADGHSLQVVTQDGQTIPVEINQFHDDDDDVEDEQEAVIQHVEIQKSIDSGASSPVTHYFTIV